MRARHDPQVSRLSQPFRKAVSLQWQFMAAGLNRSRGSRSDTTVVYRLRRWFCEVDE